MKPSVPRVLVLATLLAAPFVLTAPSVQASTAYTGSILLGNHVSGAGAGPTELVFACDAHAPTEGVDGAWYEIAGEGTAFRLDVAPTLDGDVWFYLGPAWGCSWLESYTGAEAGLGEAEIGPVHPEAEWALVVGSLGTGDYTLTLFDPA